jgi:hypothetical protein
MYMAKTKKKVSNREADSVYFLKILLFFLLGTIWIKYNGYVVFPIGLGIGLLFVHNDHFSIDRKSEYVILIISALMGLIGYGLFVAIPQIKL